MPFFIDITVIWDAFYLRFFASTSITGMLKAWELIATRSEVKLTCSRTVQMLTGAPCDVWRSLDSDSAISAAWASWALRVQLWQHPGIHLRLQFLQRSQRWTEVYRY